MLLRPSTQYGDGMKSAELRQRFFDFFIQRGHKKVPSSSLIPAHDPTLLFTNAGMNQFKEIFLGQEKRSYSRAVSIQKCMRAGGKHNDLDNVGFTKRHLTFFEMMGNFSFGDYFKKDAIQYVWEFLTNEVKLPKDELYVSVFRTDDEAYELWQSIAGLPADRIYRLGEKDNFWQMGDLGPCGPCSEVHIDRGPDFGCADIAKCGPACECDRFLEIWNIVFMQYDRQPDGSFKDLAQKSIDTGMGLERLASIVQQKDSVFETDLFADLIQAIEKMSGRSYAAQDAANKAAFHVLVDHARAAVFLIADGCIPSNEGRGYVLRKIIRRAALFETKLSEKTVFPALADVVIEQMGVFYPELTSSAAVIRETIEGEVKKFTANLQRGQQLLARVFDDAAESKKITGQEAFKLYDTYGFPLELVIAVARERGYKVDEQGFEKEMSKQQERSGKTSGDPLDHLELSEQITTEYIGHEEFETTSEIVALVCGHESVLSVAAGQICWLITPRSPFHVVGGGQVSDEGWAIIDQHRVSVKDVRYISGRIALQVEFPMDVSVGDSVTLIVNERLRQGSARNHTATHLLQAALMEVFGKQVRQAGSVVHPDYLRFDFAYPSAISAKDLMRVERLVNENILQNLPLSIEHTTMQDAVDRGAIAFFGDKYNPDEVRVVTIGDFSMELCGGTHVRATGDIGLFKITELTAPSAGHKRIVAVTGMAALALTQETFATVKQLGQEFKVPRDEVLEAVSKQAEQLKSCREEVQQFKTKYWQAHIPHWLEQAKTVGEMSFLTLQLDEFAASELREIAKRLDTQKPGFYFLTSVTDGRQLFYCTISDQWAQQVDLKKLGAFLKERGIRGGGSGQVLQGGSETIDDKLADAVSQWLEESL